MGGAGGAGAGGAGVVDRAAGDNEAVRFDRLRALRRRVVRSVVMGVYAKRETPPTGCRGGNEGPYPDSVQVVLLPKVRKEETRQWRY